MADDDFNMSMRKFLKRVGVTSQQQIEEAVRAARDAGTLPAGALKAEVVLKVEGIDLTHRIEGEISQPDD
ncbi:hypothetical protein DC366_00300 [Pelagivirga sediminicola]|uniref:Uncharacterized protein n=1 Tax=Pelagivirga sediminicola TaxID=2170575 RepID=A0A2T7GAL7_9RHOB|nr:DUF6494 family protein [Pelagivirga sediminicola]PVA11461.1 hypothetical protein DC366_00300 [Pelagivirga sediminicola]